MLVLNRKRLSLIVGCLFVAVFAFMFTRENNNEQTTPTVSLPVSGKTIVVDARTRCSRRTEQSQVMEQQKQKQI